VAAACAVLSSAIHRVLAASLSLRLGEADLRLRFAAAERHIMASADLARLTRVTSFALPDWPGPGLQIDRQIIHLLPPLGRSAKRRATESECRLRVCSVSGHPMACQIMAVGCPKRISVHVNVLVRGRRSPSRRNSCSGAKSESALPASQLLCMPQPTVQTDVSLMLATSH
jgi:hypothetical protein